MLPGLGAPRLWLRMPNVGACGRQDERRKSVDCYHFFPQLRFPLYCWKREPFASLSQISKAVNHLVNQVSDLPPCESFWKPRARVTSRTQIFKHTKNQYATSYFLRPNWDPHIDSFKNGFCRKLSEYGK